MWLINIIVIKLNIIFLILIGKLENIFYFQYIKTCLWLLGFFSDKDKKLSTLPLNVAMGSIFSMFFGFFELLNHPQTIYKNEVYFGHPIHYGALKAN